MARKRRKKSRNYFTQDTEDAIVLYNNTSDPEIRSKIYERNKARSNKNYELADRIRQDLFEKGILIEDKDGTTSWKLK